MVIFCFKDIYIGKFNCRERLSKDGKFVEKSRGKEFVGFRKRIGVVNFSLKFVEVERVNW